MGATKRGPASVPAQPHRRCACPLWGSGDARGCLEVREYGHTPALRNGDVLDGVIVVDLLVFGAVISGDLSDDDECECGCHLDDGES